MAEANEEDSSDTDSEEELDSPRKIVQQPTSENMDVDANDGRYSRLLSAHAGFDIYFCTNLFTQTRDTCPKVKTATPDFQCNISYVGTLSTIL